MFQTNDWVKNLLKLFGTDLSGLARPSRVSGGASVGKLIEVD